MIKVSAQIKNMAESDDFFKGELILLDLMDEEELDDIFGEDINIVEVGKYIGKYKFLC